MKWSFAELPLIVGAFDYALKASNTSLFSREVATYDPYETC